jgi:hypothetical protein
MFSTHASPATPKAIRKAPLMHVKKSTTSRKLWKLSGHAKYVRVVGTWLNDGKLGHIKAGFPTTSTYPGDIMVFNVKTHKYEHGYHLQYRKTTSKHFKFFTKVKVHGTWVSVAVYQSCFNDFHGKVNTFFQKVVQVESENEVVHDITVHAASGGWITVSGSLQCPSGTLYGSASVYAFGEDWITIHVKQSASAKEVEAAKVQALSQARISAQAGFQAMAIANIHLHCSSTPPPSTPAPMLFGADTVNDVLVNNTRTVTVHGSLAPGHGGTLVAQAANGGTITVNGSQHVTNGTDGTFTATVTYMAPSEAPQANGDIAYDHDRVDFTLIQDDGQSAHTSTNSFGITVPVPDAP